MTPETAATGVVQPEREQVQNRRSGPTYSTDRLALALTLTIALWFGLIALAAWAVW